jgi:L-glyceraldehyde 3-phosphate reductase
MYKAASNRYDKMMYNRVGKSGLKLPQLSLGFWQNFGYEKDYEEVKEIVLKAFDSGITHFDLANNYGRPGGSAETNLGKILKEELAPYRDELIISTKAGYGMWPGPYGDNGSRKYLMASLDQSLERLGLKYVDIFYHHRPDYDTPLKETMKALADIVSQGKALYVGISNYPTDRALEAIKILREMESKDEAQAFLPKVISKIDKLAKKNLWHKNKAANLKSKLAKHVAVKQVAKKK